MWLILAVASAFFAGITSILAKLGLKNVDSTVATALRTTVVLVFAWALVLITGAQSELGTISAETWMFLVLSGLATGASWLCYFKALQLGDVNRVVPIDKSSTVMAILLAIVLLGEGISVAGAIGVVLIAVGTLAMIERKDVDEVKVTRSGWLLFAFGSAVFAALTSILGKVGMEGVDSNLGTAIRTVVVLAMSWVMVMVSSKRSEIRGIRRNDAIFIVLSGLATGASWLCFFKALQEGPASIVVPIDKLSILATVLFSFVVLNERLSKKAALGLAGIVIGTMLMLL
ncbi:MAG: EamA family transporter [Candidatus Methanomethylophilaceae archaeon]|nr:EamA family transporter [Candidatus Methanomethylophilaceae archaeon]